MLWFVETKGVVKDVHISEAGAMCKKQDNGVERTDQNYMQEGEVKSKKENIQVEKAGVSDSQSSLIQRCPKERREETGLGAEKDSNFTGQTKTW